MEPELATGSEAFLIVRGPGGEPEAFEGYVEAFRDGAFIVRPITHDAPSYVPELHEPRNITPHPMVVQRREEGRYPSWIEGVIYPQGSRRGRNAIISDLSMHGASIEAPEWGKEEKFRLAIPHGEREIIFEGTIVGVESALRGVLLHTRFARLTQAQREVLGDLVDLLRTHFDEAQEYLATKHVSPNHV